MSYARNRLRKEKRHIKLYGLCVRCGKPFSSERQIFRSATGRPLHWNDCIIREWFLGKKENPFLLWAGEEYIHGIHRILFDKFNQTPRTGHSPEDYK